MQHAEPDAIVRESRPGNALHSGRDRAVALSDNRSVPAEVEPVGAVACIEGEAEGVTAIGQLEIRDLGGDRAPTLISDRDVEPANQLGGSDADVAEIDSLELRR